MTDINKKKIVDCCSEKKYKNIKILSKLKKNLTRNLIIFFAIVVVVNIIAMALFTFSVNSKLGEAVDIAKPQEGTLTLIKPLDCESCGDMLEEKTVLLAQNIEILDDKVIFANDDTAKELIKKLNISKLPALIFQSEENIKSKLSRAFKNNLRLFEEKTLVWEKTKLPFFDNTSNKTVGLVNTIYIVDKTCDVCFDVVQTQKPILQRFGIVFASEKLVDISDLEGQELIDRYNIKSVPTIIMSKEAGDYNSLRNVWSKVGSVEDDGVFIFRDLDVIGVNYKDLDTNTVILSDKK
ncbi:MAG: hypothetical protein L3J07_01770 [Candidatus Magasanikbacteria bacterium]|nr:hypothetical protein [Candidatus Magasanikbacteria bacterium]